MNLIRTDVPPVVEAWSTYRTGTAAQWTARRLVRAKRATGATVSVVIPARNEESTVGAIVATIHRELVKRHRLVDELIVVDSRSRDATAVVAAAAGAIVVCQDAMTRGLPGSTARATRSGPASRPRPATSSRSSTPTCASSSRIS